MQLSLFDHLSTVPVRSSCVDEPLAQHDQPGAGSSPSVQLVRSRRRTIAIHVFADRIEIRAPLRASATDIQAFVARKWSWIVRRHEDLQARVGTGISLAPGAVLEFRGEACRVEWLQGERSAVTLEADRLRIIGRQLDARQAEKLFLQWLAAQANVHLSRQALALAAALGLSHRCSGFTFRYTRTLWGRCTSSGNILFNPVILLAPTAVADYLVAHEVCHLRHLNHSRAFWQLVESVCPDWQASRDWLRVHGHGLQIRA